MQIIRSSGTETAMGLGEHVTDEEYGAAPKS